MNTLKIVLVSIVSTLFTLWAQDHVWLILGTLYIGFIIRCIYNLGVTLKKQGRDDSKEFNWLGLVVLKIIMGMFWPLLFVADKEIRQVTLQDFITIFDKIMGNKKFKFQLPVLIVEK